MAVGLPVTSSLGHPFLSQASKPSGVLAVETSRFLLQLNKEQVAAFEVKIKEIAESSGWAHTSGAEAGDASGAGVHVMFKKQSA